MSSEIGKVLVFVGIFLIILGTLMVILPKVNLPLGNLPGDIKIKKDNFKFYFPIVSSLIVSIILTLVLNLIFLFMKK